MKRIFLTFLIWGYPLANVFSCYCVSPYISGISGRKEPNTYIFEASLVCEYTGDEDFSTLTRRNWFILKVHRYWGERNPGSIIVGFSDHSNCGIRGLKPNTKYLINSRELDTSQYPKFIDLDICNTTEMLKVPAIEFVKNGEGIMLDDADSVPPPCEPIGSKLKNENEQFVERLGKMTHDLESTETKYHTQSAIYQACLVVLLLVLIFSAFKNKVFGLAKMWLYTLLSSTVIFSICSTIITYPTTVKPTVIGLYDNSFVILLTITVYLILLLPSLLLLRKNIQAKKMLSILAVFLVPSLLLAYMLYEKDLMISGSLSLFLLFLIVFYKQYRKQKAWE